MPLGVDKGVQVGIDVLAIIFDNDMSLWQIVWIDVHMLLSAQSILGHTNDC